jgi:hypothetical protein
VKQKRADTRVLILAILGLVLATVIGWQAALSRDDADNATDPPCFAAKLGLPCQ